MCMKEDSMKNRELKPGYNLQVEANQQFVIAHDIFPNPTDIRTLRPFLSSCSLLDYFSTIVTDAGYDSEKNYAYVLDELEKEALIPYTMYYQKEQARKTRTIPSNATTGLIWKSWMCMSIIKVSNLVLAIIVNTPMKKDSIVISKCTKQIKYKKHPN